MSEQDSFHLTQDLTVLTPRSGKAYIVLCDEWSLIKNKIERVSSEPWFFHTVGSTLLGACLSTFITIITGAFSAQEQEIAKIVAWSVVVITFISGLLSLIFAEQQRSSKREQAKDVLAHMSLIEQRYDHSPK